VNGVNTKLFNLAKLDINLTLGAARKKFGISATNATDVPDIHACLNALLPASFLVHLLESMFILNLIIACFFCYCHKQVPHTSVR
jgi:hypothetical protein